MATEMSTHSGEASSKPKFAEIAPGAEDIRTSGWERAVAEASQAEIEYYSTQLFRRADQAEGAAKDALILLGAAASMYYDPADADEPLKPAIVFADGNRTAALGDFQDSHLDPLTEVYSELPDLELRARIADILWIKRQNHRAARAAASAYLERAKALMDPEHWVAGFRRLQRSLLLAASLGKNSPEKQAAAAYALNLLKELAGKDPLYLSKSIVELLLQARAESAANLVGYAELHAENSEANGDWTVAADYWSLARTCRLKANDNEGAQEALRRQGRAQVRVGEAMAAEGRPGLAPEHWFEQGYLSLRQGAAGDAELEALQRRLHEAQRASAENVGKIEVKTEIPPRLIRLIEQAKGKSFREAAALWGFFGGLQQKSSLRRMALEREQVAPVASLFATKILREDGKTDLVIPPLPDDPESDEDILRLHMWRLASQVRILDAWCAEQVRRIAHDEHGWSDGAFDYLLNGNPFVPPGRHKLFERGLKAALEGDYLVAAHVLLPQLENSVRHIMSLNGVVTTFVRQDGAQDEQPLTVLVRHEGFEEAFGEDFAFALRGLLVERADANVRNNAAHGLLSSDAFYSPSSVILPAVVIRILMAFSSQGVPEGT